jgi:hypothetical protein
MLSKNDLKQLKDAISTVTLTKEDGKRFSTKDDLKGLVTKDDLKSEFKELATKEDAKGFATKADLKGLLTKEDAKKFSTKNDIKVIKQDLTKIRKDIGTIVGFFDREYLDLRKRVERIEEHLDLHPTN